MPESDLIADYLATLAGKLPAPIVAELADGLTETYEHHRRRGLPATDAGAAAVAEFGDAATVIASLVVASPARRAARSLLFTGPPVGGAWASVLVAHHAWDWHVGTDARIMFGGAILAAVLLLALAAFGSCYRQAVLSAAAASLVTLTIDVAILGYLSMQGIITVSSVLVPASLSSARIGYTLSRLPRLLLSA